MDGEAWQNTIHGVAKIGHDLATKQYYLSIYIYIYYRYVKCLT